MVYETNILCMMIKYVNFNHNIWTSTYILYYIQYVYVSYYVKKTFCKIVIVSYLGIYIKLNLNDSIYLLLYIILHYVDTFLCCPYRNVTYNKLKLNLLV